MAIPLIPTPIPFTPTINILKANYQTYLQSANSAINAFAPNSFWDIDSGAMAAILLDLYMNLQIVQNSSYPQYATGDQCDQWLYSRGLPARVGTTYGTIDCLLTSSTPDTIPAYTIFSLGAIQYQTLQIIIIPDGSTLFTLYAVNKGIQQLPIIGNILTAGSRTAIINSNIISGTNEESDQSCVNRILQSILIPPGGSRESDYYNFCFLADNSVTGAIVFPGFSQVAGVSGLGIFPLVGNIMNDYLLDQSFSAYVLYSRQATSTTITNVNTYIQNQKLVGLTVTVGTCITYTLDMIISSFIVTVSLLSSYNLTSIVTIASQDNNNNPTQVSYSITQLIQREIRRAICNQPFGGTVINNINYITVESLITAVNTQLSATNGILAQLITNITFNFTDIIVPAINASFPNAQTNATYDVPSYSYIQVASI